jgi:Tol biopolymer transport system component
MLVAGSTLGPYKILALLGAGGMGEVYRAHDTRLGRDVAIKVLAPHLAATPEVRARFEREARTISQLNHPHICTLHDVGHQDGTDYLVMELLEGETLAHRLERGPLPVAEVLSLGTQIADALDRAHRAGVVHRDLKPGNVMLTKSGAKLMDFGLARAAGLAAAPGTLTESPTVSRPLTAEGTIVGTFQYMAPEQLEGKEADARSDLWALGCVLYEMATGKRAFEGQSQASLIAAIMTGEPRVMTELRPVTPAGLEKIVHACLAKSPDDRVQSAHDVRLQLEWMEPAGASMSSAPLLGRGDAVRRPRWLMLALVGVAAVAVTALVMSWLPRVRTVEAERPVQRFILGAVPLTPFDTPSISADGRTVFYSAVEGDSRRIFRRSLESFDATPIAGTEGGSLPFLSPDGGWLGFITADAIKKVPLEGGAPQRICSGVGASFAHWGPDGTILFSTTPGSGDGRMAIGRVPASGGRPEVVVPADSTPGTTWWVDDILPDGRSFLFTRAEGDIDMSIEAVVGGSRHTVLRRAGSSRYAAPFLLYIDQDSGSLLAAPFDATKAVVTGAAFPVTEDIEIENGFDVSPAGSLVYVPGEASAGDQGEVVWVDRSGSVSSCLDTRGAWKEPRLSPDGRRLLLRKRSVYYCELWSVDLDRGGLTRITSGGDNHDPVWSPDGRRAAFSCVRGTAASIIVLAQDGGRSIDTLMTGRTVYSPSSWSADGQWLAYSCNSYRTQSDIWLLPVGGRDRRPLAYLQGRFNEANPAFSPDGKWIAYDSDESGRSEVYVSAYTSPGRVQKVSTGGGRWPRWSRDGKELFYVSGQTMVAVSIETGPALRVGTPRTLFGGNFIWARQRPFDVSPDGRRFVMIRQNAHLPGYRELRMVVNWQKDIERLRSHEGTGP